MRAVSKFAADVCYSYGWVGAQMYSYPSAATRGSTMKGFVYSAAGTVVPNSQGKCSEDLDTKMKSVSRNSRITS